MTTTTHAITRASDDRARARQLELSPRVDILEEAEFYAIVADMPGAEPSSVEVDVERGTLTLTAERQLPRATVRYRRSFGLPDGTDPDGIAATLAHGVLTVRVPRAGSLRKRRVPVIAG